MERLTACAEPVSAHGQVLLDSLRAAIAEYPITPVIRCRLFVAGRQREILLKLEGHSPWGSIKGRTALGLLASIVGRVDSPARIVESTSGNLGVALAELAGSADLDFTAVVDETLPSALADRLKRYEARLVNASTPISVSGLQRRLDTVVALLHADPELIWLNQYENPANPLTHELWTAPELRRQAPAVQAVFVAASTGGTLAGVSRHLRSVAPTVRVVGVDVEGSSVFGGASGPRILSGVGASRPSRHLRPNMVDAVEIVAWWQGILLCRWFEDDHGIALGGSSGVLLAACLRMLAAHEELTQVLCICPDLGDRYADTIYSDEWIARHSTGQSDGHIGSLQVRESWQLS